MKTFKTLFFILAAGSAFNSMAQDATIDQFLGEYSLATETENCVSNIRVEKIEETQESQDPKQELTCVKITEVGARTLINEEGEEVKADNEFKLCHLGAGVQTTTVKVVLKPGIVNYVVTNTDVRLKDKELTSVKIENTFNAAMIAKRSVSESLALTTTEEGVVFTRDYKELNVLAFPKVEKQSCIYR